jgi:hypothetical protein
MKPITGREAEEPCRKAYDSYLKSQYPSACVRWEKPEQDPPDFWLTMDDRRCAVEVTTLMQSLGRDRRPWRAVFNAIGEFVCRLDKRLNGVKPSNGICSVHIEESLPQDDRKFCKKLLSNTVEVVKRVCATGYRGKVAVRHSDMRWVTVRLVPSAKNRVDIWHPAFAFFPTVEADETLSAALRKKMQKLQKANVPHPWILLLWIDGFLEPQNYQEIDLPKDIGNFETVFVVDRNRTGFLLHHRGEDRAHNSMSGRLRT